MTAGTRQELERKLKEREREFFNATYRTILRLIDDRPDKVFAEFIMGYHALERARCALQAAEQAEHPAGTQSGSPEKVEGPTPVTAKPSAASMRAAVVIFDLKQRKLSSQSAYAKAIDAEFRPLIEAATELQLCIGASPEGTAKARHKVREALENIGASK